MGKNYPNSVFNEFLKIIEIKRSIPKVSLPALESMEKVKLQVWKKGMLIRNE